MQLLQASKNCHKLQVYSTGSGNHFDMKNVVQIHATTPTSKSCHKFQVYSMGSGDHFNMKNVVQIHATTPDK